MLRKITAEFLGTAFLLAGVVGSGIMAERLSGGNVAIALLANTLATGGVLVCMIAAFIPISGAHFNPIVSLNAALSGDMTWPDFYRYAGAQLAGACTGSVLANLMFGLPAITLSHHQRSGPGIWLGEIVATIGLLIVIRLTAAARIESVPYAVAAYIVGAYWFTSSTSFANPAVTVARTLSDSFAGIRAIDAPAFIIAELAGCVAATLILRWSFREA